MLGPWWLKKACIVNNIDYSTKKRGKICNDHTSSGNGTISNCSAISGTIPLANAMIAVQEKARL